MKLTNLKTLKNMTFRFTHANCLIIEGENEKGGQGWMSIAIAGGKWKTDLIWLDGRKGYDYCKHDNGSDAIVVISGYYERSVYYKGALVAVAKL